MFKFKIGDKVKLADEVVVGERYEGVTLYDFMAKDLKQGGVIERVFKDDQYSVELADGLIYMCPAEMLQPIDTVEGLNISTRETIIEYVMGIARANLEEMDWEELLETYELAKEAEEETELC